MKDEEAKISLIHSINCIEFINIVFFTILISYLHSLEVHFYFFGDIFLTIWSIEFQLKIAFNLVCEDEIEKVTSSVHTILLPITLDSALIEIHEPFKIFGILFVNVQSEVDLYFVGLFVTFFKCTMNSKRLVVIILPIGIDHFGVFVKV